MTWPRHALLHATESPSWVVIRYIIYETKCMFVRLLCLMHDRICGPIRTKLCMVTKGALLTDIGGRMWYHPHGGQGNGGQNI